MKTKNTKYETQVSESSSKYEHFRQMATADDKEFVEERRFLECDAVWLL
jgi:hypothetical protein